MYKEKMKEILGKVYLGKNGVRNYFIILSLIMLMIFTIAILITRGIYFVQYHSEIFYIMVWLVYINWGLDEVVGIIDKSKKEKKIDNLQRHKGIYYISFVFFFLGLFLYGILFLKETVPNIAISIFISANISIIIWQCILYKGKSREVITWKHIVVDVVLNIK